jgi:hypothetical protein
MGSNVVNLNQFRKKKQREEKARLAEINRAKHGRTKAEKEGERAGRERAARTLDGARLEDDGDEIEDDEPVTESTDEGDAKP